MMKIVSIALKYLICILTAVALVIIGFVLADKLITSHRYFAYGVMFILGNLYVLVHSIIDGKWKLDKEENFVYNENTKERK